ncbi:unnamed protein product [Caenorhabditis bovis]|uniref:Uncharacterized protein n=1 Tax=Caenorhabditis bovis TaxID=2654633 RepID=A0A8S1ECH4_9PELO|nr:unnamed protein product [Caenorhabditis bovis]
MIRNVRRRISTFVSLLFTLFLFTTTIHSNARNSEKSAEMRASRLSFSNLRDVAWHFLGDDEPREPLLAHHPFNNTCRFFLPNIYADDIIPYRLSERKRQFRCPLEDLDYATMDNEGYMYVHPHFVNYPNTTKNVSCKVVIIEGGLRQPEKNKTKNDFYEVAVLEAPENQRFWVNADAFLVRCHRIDGKNETVWEKAFASIRDDQLNANKIFNVSDLQSFGNFGEEFLKAPRRPQTNRYSIDIMGFDSTSRNMFMRHLPRSTEIMKKLGYHFLYGYTKIADNSMVNLAPILIGEVKEAQEKPKTDASGDINIDSILPQRDALDPTNLDFLWKMMGEKFGCKSMFNEDISMKGLGLFNYPNHEFQPGFRKNPADHYYRPYYLAVYHKWKYSQCKDGGQIQNEFISLWKRFALYYKDICHFGFSFVTTLTHEATFMLEVIDEQLSYDLSQLYIAGALDNTLSVIMGDHGNRIGAIQFSYTGRIEERMPLMAIRLPTGFKDKYPVEYRNFIENKYKLTGNFDIHKTLEDIVEMRFGEKRENSPPSSGRGISLFDSIPNDRECKDAFIPENFCMCMIDVSNVTTPLAKTNMPETKT